MDRRLQYNRSRHRVTDALRCSLPRQQRPSQPPVGPEGGRKVETPRDRRTIAARSGPHANVFSRGVGRDWDTRIRTTELTTEDFRGERAGTCVFRWWVAQVTVTLHSTRTPLREQARPAPPPRSLSRSIECASRVHNRNTSARRMWNYHSEDEMRERNGQSRRARRNMAFDGGCATAPPFPRMPRGQSRPHRRRARYRGRLSFLADSR
jgi:hypothetical protein